MHMHTHCCTTYLHFCIHLQYNQWTALFFALEGAQNQDLEVFNYLLSLGKRRVDIEHKDRVRDYLLFISRIII